MCDESGFIDMFGNEVYEALFEAFYAERAAWWARSQNGNIDSRFVFIDIEHLDTGTNYRFECQYTEGNNSVYIYAEDGNWNGSRIIEFIVDETDEGRLNRLLSVSSEDFWGIAG